MSESYNDYTYNQNSIKLKVNNLTVMYDNKIVLEDINFDVQRGEFLSILGPSGCGKTTLLRTLIGLIHPVSGKILKDNLDITYNHPSSRGMGIVFQNYALFQNMTVLENVEYALKIKKNSKKNSREEALSIINHVGLEKYINEKPCNLSGGQQQRVAIARTMVLKPEIILFDEPMSALDVETRLSLRKVIKDIQKKFGTTMIYITHDQEEAFAMSDRIIVMDVAKISQIDTPINIIKYPSNSYVTKFVINNLQEKINSLVKYTGLMI